MKFKQIILYVLLFSFALFAQNKMLTMEDAILGKKNNLKTKKLKQLDWRADSNSFFYIDSLNGAYGIISRSIDTEAEMLFSQDTLNKLLESDEIAEVESFPDISWSDANHFHFWQDEQLLQVDIKSKILNILNKTEVNAENIDLHEETFRTSFTVGNNLFISYNPEQIIPITFDTEDGISNGSSYIHRNEFGLTKGTYWSPNANYLAYYHLDERMVTTYPLVDLESRPAALNAVRYPMTGMTSEQVQVAIYDLNTGSTIYLQTGQPQDQYLPQVLWDPSEKYMYVTHLNREQNHLRLVKYDVQTGQPLQTLFEEKNEHWVEPDILPQFVPGSKDELVWFTKKDGYHNIYLYKTNGKLVRQLTKNKFDLNDFIGFDNDSQYLFYAAASEDGMNNHIYRVKINNGKSEKLTESAGIHSAKFCKSGKYFLDTFTDINTPYNVYLQKTGVSKNEFIYSAEDVMSEYAMGNVQFVKIPTEDGIELNGRIILPPDFDATKKYPVIVYVYGGPHGQMIRNSYISGWPRWYFYMAQQGYIVFSLDNRGTNNRGLAFEQVIHRQLGKYEVEDQMRGIEYLKSLPYVDTERLGVHGWSYGGFMTISMLTKNPSVFKVAVAGGPVIDWRYYEVMYGERYMDTPQSNLEGYEQASLFNYIKDLEGKLLVIHGGVDPVVPIQNSMLYLRRSIDEGKQLDFFVYPEDEHNMRGKDRIHLYQKITDYFKLHL